jgi:hypothetical protein
VVAITEAQVTFRITICDLTCKWRRTSERECGSDVTIGKNLRDGVTEKPQYTKLTAVILLDKRKYLEALSNIGQSIIDIDSTTCDVQNVQAGFKTCVYKYIHKLVKI